jgi:hypothetical protein
MLKYISHTKFCLKSLLVYPNQTLKEFICDFKKDYYAEKVKSKSNFVWCAGLPKSGTTLIEKIFENLPYINMKHSMKRIYYPGKTDHVHGISSKMFSNLPKDKFTFLKTHSPYSTSYEKIALEKNAKIIISLRDLRDVMISRYHHVISEKTHRHHKVINNLNFEDGFIKSLNLTDLGGTPVIEEYYNWIYDWLKIAKERNYLVLWFEDYKTNELNYINKILNYIGLKELSSKQILDLTNKKTSKSKKYKLSDGLKKYGRERSTFRSGEINQWKKVFNFNIKKAFEEKLPNNIEFVLKKS